MAEPTSSLTFYDLILRIAETIGSAFYGSDGQKPAMVPTDRHDLDRCKRIANDAIRMFISLAPENGWKWRRRLASITFPTWVEGTADSGTANTIVDSARTEVDSYFVGWTLYIESGTGAGEYATITGSDQSSTNITFSGGLSGSSTPDSTSVYKIFDSVANIINYDPARYLMPEDFGGAVLGDATYIKNTSHGTPIFWCDESYIRALRQDGPNTGYPSHMAVRPYLPTSSLGASRRWELIIDPQPVAADTIEIPYTACFDKLQIESGVATGGAATTLIDTTNRFEANDYFNGWTLTILDGTGAGQTAAITDYDRTTQTLTFTALSGGSTPDTTSAYVLQPAANVHPAGIMFDQAILDACKCQIEMQVKDVLNGAIEYFHKVSIPAAHRIDKGAAPRSVGNLNAAKNAERPFTWKNVEYSGH